MKKKEGEPEGAEGASSLEFRPAGAPGDDPLTRTLKKVYDDVAAEPIPEDWLKLLDQLDKRAGEGRGDV